jgi:hypothetical protein
VLSPAFQAADRHTARVPRGRTARHAPGRPLGIAPHRSLLAGLTAELAGTVWVFILAGLIPAVGGTALALKRFPAAGPGGHAFPSPRA